MKKFTEMTDSELETYERSYRKLQESLASMIRLLDLEPVSFKKTFKVLFESTIKNVVSFDENKAMDETLEAQKKLNAQVEVQKRLQNGLTGIIAEKGTTGSN